MWRAIISAAISVTMLSLGLWALGATLHTFEILGAIVITVIGGLGLIGNAYCLVSDWLENHMTLFGSGTVPAKSVTICDKSASRGPTIAGCRVRSRVYVSGPISQGDSQANCRQAIQIGFQLMDAGYAPYVPHYSYFVDPKSTSGKGRYAQWLQIDYSWISVCHALLRLPGDSRGADREVEWANNHGIPVFYTLDDLMATVPPEQV